MNHSIANYGNTNQLTISQEMNHNGSRHISVFEIHERVTLALRLLNDVAGTVTNCLLLVVCYKHQRVEHSAVGILIMELVASWLFNLAVSYPWGDVGRIIILSGWSLGKWYCIARIEFNMSTSVLSNCFDACLAINRFVAICLPLHYKVINTRLGIFVMNFCTFGFTAIVLLPVMGIGGHYINVGQTECAFITDTQAEKSLNFLTQFLPVAVIGTFSSLTIIRVMLMACRDWTRRRVGVEGNYQQDPQRKTMQRRVQLSTMLFAQYLFSILCGLPYIVLNIHFRTTVYVWYPYLNFWIGLLYRVPYSVCPVIMIWLNRDYLKTVKTMLPSTFTDSTVSR